MHNKMFNSVDLYLGAFLVLCGFSLSLLNLQRVMKKNKFSAVLLSENVFLMCIGLAFLTRAVYQYDIVNMHMKDMQGRTINIVSMNRENESTQCTIWSMIFGYGPLIISFVNSFVSLVIDNYLHYEMLKDVTNKENENIVHDISERSVTDHRFEMKRCFMFGKKYFSYIIIALQWTMPIFMSLFMLPMGVNEKSVRTLDVYNDKCMVMMNFQNKTCVNDKMNNSQNLVQSYYEPFDAFLEADELNKNRTSEIGSVVKNLYKIISDMQNNSFPDSLERAQILRHPRKSSQCMTICFVDNNNLILYMFVIAILCYFVPITISTIILTKIHIMQINRLNVKTYVSRELLYNILFWTPVMFDTFISLIFCSYSMSGMKTSLLNVIANVYQAVKNFMNTKNFNENIVSPV